jgi:hypothetical protein
MDISTCKNVRKRQGRQQLYQVKSDSHGSKDVIMPKKASMLTYRDRGVDTLDVGLFYQDFRRSLAQSLDLLFLQALASFECLNPFVQIHTGRFRVTQRLHKGTKWILFPAIYSQGMRGRLQIQEEINGGIAFKDHYPASSGPEIPNR